MSVCAPPARNFERELSEALTERANHLADVRRVIEWLHGDGSGQRRRANSAFTEGPERTLAYLFEDMQSRIDALARKVESVNRSLSSHASTVRLMRIAMDNGGSLPRDYAGLAGE